jgi:hypothetical protein
VYILARVPVSLALEEDLQLAEDLVGEAGANVALVLHLVMVSDVAVASARLSHHSLLLQLQVAWVATWVEASLRLEVTAVEASLHQLRQLAQFPVRVAWVATVPGASAHDILVVASGEAPVEVLVPDQASSCQLPQVVGCRYILL